MLDSEKARTSTQKKDAQKKGLENNISQFMYCRNNGSVHVFLREENRNDWHNHVGFFPSVDEKADLDSCCSFIAGQYFIRSLPAGVAQECCLYDSDRVPVRKGYVKDSSGRDRCNDYSWVEIDFERDQ